MTSVFDSFLRELKTDNALKVELDIPKPVKIKRVKKEKPQKLTEYSCSYPGCQLTFPHEKRAKKHLKDHPLMPPIKYEEMHDGSIVKCLLCERTHELKHLYQHYRESHNEAPTYKCRFCNQLFTYKRRR